jgi:hypothetical protein
LADSTDYTTYHIVDENGNITTDTGKTTIGVIYKVAQMIDGNKRKYVYIQSKSEDSSGDLETEQLVKGEKIVENLEDGLCYTMIDGNKIAYIDFDLNSYKSAYRYASTPWIVSNLLGDAKNLKVEKMFRFHTISDGDAANREVKVSIENVRTDDKVFDVMIHDINDTDENPIILEKFVRCTMVPGSANYIAYKIGSYDGSYESKSKYVTVEVNESIIAQSASPAGFLGYPSINFSGYTMMGKTASNNIVKVPVAYNTKYDPDVKNRKQYFGLSSRVGVDVDLFTFKGNVAYIENQNNMTPGFHLDSRLEKLDSGATKTGVVTIGKWDFSYVGMDNASNTLNNIPIIDTE